MSDPWRLDGRVALVIGAGRGLGRGCALELARAGARVVLVARTEAELAEAAAEAGNDAVAIVADVTEPSEVARVVADGGRAGRAARAGHRRRDQPTRAGAGLPGRGLGPAVRPQRARDVPGLPRVRRRAAHAWRCPVRS